MQISIDTANLSDLDRQILGLLVGGVSLPVPMKRDDVDYPVVKKAAAKKAAAKPEPEPEPTPEPMAEEPVVEEPVVEETDDEEQSDEDLLALAVKKATEMVAGGQAAE